MSHPQARQARTEDRRVTLVLGGVRSGKSRYAQQLGERANRVVFIATAEARADREMQTKIERHGPTAQTTGQRSRNRSNLPAPFAPPRSAPNEVGSGVVPAYALGRRFRDLTGEINQRIAAQADNVVFMVAGLPLILKGTLPGWTLPRAAECSTCGFTRRR